MPDSPDFIRSNFSPLALFVGSATTNSEGRAEIPITLPDNLTRYRIMAVAAHGDRCFGKGDSALTARLPLMVRPSPPRFLNRGDQFELPVVVQNQMEEPQEVFVGARAANLELTSPGSLVTIPANDRVEVRLPAASNKPGTAKVQFAASGSGEHSADAAFAEIPVLTPATAEAFASTEKSMLMKRSNKQSPRRKMASCR